MDMNQKCIIFDLDGTLVDSELLKVRALMGILPQVIDKEEIVNDRYLGKKLAEVILDIEKRYKFSIPNDFVATFRKTEAKLFESELKLIPNVRKMLKNMDYPMCIASNGPLDKMKHSLRITGLSEYFGSKLFSAYDIGSWKPDPGLFLTAAREMGVKPSHCIVVEDSSAGVEAAKAAKMKICHFSSCRVEPDGPNYRLFNDMGKLPALLKEIINTPPHFL